MQSIQLYQVALVSTTPLALHPLSAFTPTGANTTPMGI